MIMRMRMGIMMMVVVMMIIVNIVIINIIFMFFSIIVIMVMMMIMVVMIIFIIKMMVMMVMMVIIPLFPSSKKTTVKLLQCQNNSHGFPPKKLNISKFLTYKCIHRKKGTFSTRLVIDGTPM